MRKIRDKSSSNSGHPYWNLKNWASGKFCYWRDNAWYSPETKEKLEQRLQAMIDNTKNLSSFS